MIIVFDLDDTLYEEITYVKGGLKAVANYLFRTYQLDTPERIYGRLFAILLKKGRGRIFDIFLQENKLLKKNIIKKCLSIYRSHDPKISLSYSGAACLERLRCYPKYLLTDGNKVVQSKKVKSLKIDRYFKHIIITHNYGLKNSKPSTYCFHKILQWEKARPRDLVYIGDNPKKDFLNIKKDGFKTVRVLTGEHKEVEVPLEYEADFRIKTLDELSLKFLTNLFRY